MKYIRSLIIILLVSVFAIYCKEEKKMTLRDFLVIEEEILSSDLTNEAEEAIVKKYGFNREQYKNFEDQIESDPKLKAKAGEMRLQMHTEMKKIK